jgi:hypothetical protein
MFDNQGMGTPNLEGGKVQPGQGIYAISENPVCDLGHKIVLGDKVFRYARAGGTLTIGTIQASPVMVAHHQNQVAAVTAANLNKVTFTVGGTAVTANQYAEGEMIVQGVAVGDGWGQCYRIKSHPAAEAAATCELTLYDSIVTALIITSDISLVPNIYNKTTIFTASSQADVAVGATPRAVTDTYYYWMQTRGWAAILADESYAAYTPLVPGSSTDGSLEAFDADGTLEQLVARGCSVAGVDGDMCPVYLTLE